MISNVQLPKKPRYGSPCNGCGICCALQICQVGEMAFPGAKAPCPALKISGDRTVCELVVVEVVHGLEPKIQEALAIGQGCTMEDEQ